MTKRFFSKAEQQGGKNFYYTRDHVGSPRINASGKEKVGTVDLPYTDTGGILDRSSPERWAQVQDFQWEPSAGPRRYWLQAYIQ